MPALLVLVIGGIASLVVFGIVGLAIVRGWVLSILWGWFMVPVFGLPTISITQGIGIALVITFLTHQSVDCAQKEKTDREKWIYAVLAISSPLITLLFGYIVHLFM